MKIAENIMSRCATESFNDTSFIHQGVRTFVRSIWTDSTKLTSIHVGSSRWHHRAHSFGAKLGMLSSRHGLVLVGLESKASKAAVKSSLEVFNLEKFVVMMSQSHPFLCYLHIFDNESHKNESKGQKVPTAISETASWSEKQPILEVCPTLSKKHVWSQIRWMYAPFNPRVLVCFEMATGKNFLESSTFSHRCSIAKIDPLMPMFDHSWNRCRISAATFLLEAVRSHRGKWKFHSATNCNDFNFYLDFEAMVTWYLLRTCFGLIS